MTPDTQNLIITLLVSVFIPLITLYVKNKKDKYDAKRDNASTDLDAVREAKNSLETIKEQNNEILELSSQLLVKKNQISQLQGELMTIKKQLDDAKIENANLKENITKMNNRIDTLNKLIKDSVK